MADRTPEEGTPLDLQTAAERLGVHYQTAYQWVRSGALPAVRVRGRYRIDPSELTAFQARREQPSEVPPPARPPRWEALGDRLRRQLLDGDEPAARSLVTELHDRGVPATDVIHHLLAPALRAIGDGWAGGTVGISEEHRASALVERLLGALAPNPTGRRRGVAVVAAPSGDRHTLPTSMAAVALREDRWRVEHLGSDVPAAEILRFARCVDADLVVLTVTNPERTAEAGAVQAELERAGVPAVVGGPGGSLHDLQVAARALSPAARRGRSHGR